MDCEKNTCDTSQAIQTKDVRMETSGPAVEEHEVNSSKMSKPFRPLNSLTPDQWKSSLQEKNFDEVVNLSVGVLSLLHAALEEKDNMKNDLEILQGKFNEVKDINNNYLQFQKTDKGSQTERDDANVGSVTPVQELFKLDNHAAIPNNGLPLLYLENTTSSMVNPVTLNGPLPMGPDIKTPDTFGDISQPNAASFTIILSDDQMQLINGYETGEATTSSFAAENVNVIPVESSSNDGTVPSTSAMCKICKKLLATKRSLSTHMSVMHRMEGNTPISHECQSCHKAYRTPYNLRRHKCKARGD